MEYFKLAAHIVAGLLAVGSFIPYIHSIIAGKTKPSKATWVIWMILSVIIATAMWSKGTLNAQMMVIVPADMLVVYLAFRGYGTDGWTQSEVFCLVGAAVGILAWAITRDPIVGLVIAIVVNTFGSWPTIEKCWTHPEQENALAYLLFALSGMFEIIALGEVNNWTLENALQPIYYVAMGGIIWALASRNTTRRAYL